MLNTPWVCSVTAVMDEQPLSDVVLQLQRGVFYYVINNFVSLAYKARATNSDVWTSYIIMVDFSEGKLWPSIQGRNNVTPFCGGLARLNHLDGTLSRNRLVYLTMFSSEWDIMCRINLDNSLSDCLCSQSAQTVH